MVIRARVFHVSAVLFLPCGGIAILRRGLRIVRPFNQVMLGNDSDRSARHHVLLFADQPPENPLTMRFYERHVFSEKRYARINSRGVLRNFSAMTRFHRLKKGSRG